MAEAEVVSPENSPFTGVPIEITVAIGKAKPTIAELLSLGPQSVLSLDAQVDDPVSLFVGDKLIARGILEEQGEAAGQLVVRLTEVVDLRGGLA
ncbi:MAG: FliM/FliN family flagellar motor C-terminal domain-containing protein [Marinovum sp.]|nr:FliM/FliN family flagellar motor C-terminal domain-containing protein [Marinovum sp.]